MKNPSEMDQYFQKLLEMVRKNNQPEILLAHVNSLSTSLSLEEKVEAKKIENFLFEIEEEMKSRMGVDEFIRERHKILGILEPIFTPDNFCQITLRNYPLPSAGYSQKTLNNLESSLIESLVL